MHQILSKKERFFKQVKLTSKDEIYVGIDVHKINCHVAIRLNRAIVLTYVTPSDNRTIVRQMQRLQPALRKIVYEADPTGFSLVYTVKIDLSTEYRGLTLSGSHGLRIMLNILQINDADKAINHVFLRHGSIA